MKENSELEKKKVILFYVIWILYNVVQHSQLCHPHNGISNN